MGKNRRGGRGKVGDVGQGKEQREGKMRGGILPPMSFINQHLRYGGITVRGSDRLQASCSHVVCSNK